LTSETGFSVELSTNIQAVLADGDGHKALTFAARGDHHAAFAFDGRVVVVCVLRVADMERLQSTR
jgi:hypothetical protein